MLRALIIILLFASRAMGGDHLYLRILPQEHRKQLDSKTIYDYFAYEDREPRAIVLPSIRWKLSGGGPAHLIKEFRNLIKGGINVKKLSAELEKLVDRKNEPIKIPNTDAENVTQLLKIRWSDIYFLIGDDEFVTFGETDEGYIVCTRSESGFIARPKRENKSE